MRRHGWGPPPAAHVARARRARHAGVGRTREASAGCGALCPGRHPIAGGGRRGYIGAAARSVTPSAPPTTSPSLSWLVVSIHNERLVCETQSKRAPPSALALGRVVRSNAVPSPRGRSWTRLLSQRPHCVRAIVNMATPVDQPYDISSEENYDRPDEVGYGRPSGSEPKLVAPASAEANRTRAAALLALWSALVLSEGTIRFVASDPARDLTPGGPGLSPLALFLGGASEAAFGLAGLVIGASSLLFGLNRPEVTASFLVMQTLLSIYVFFLYVFVQPALRARDLLEPLLPGMSVGSSRVLIAMGIITSFSFCLALQGGQFLMGARLLAYQKQLVGSPPGLATAATKHNRLRSAAWSVNMLVGGLSTVVAGALLAREVTGTSTFPAFFAAPPHVGVYPVLTLVTGLMMVAYAGLGVAAAAAGRLYWALVAATLPTYVVMYLNFALVQVGGIGMGRAIEAAPLHSGLVAVTVALAPYFAAEWSKEREAMA